MPNILAGNVDIAYDTFGSRKSPAIILIAGLSCQMIAWDDAWCKKLSENDFFVIRFDNRDIGLSQKFDNEGLPNVSDFFKNLLSGKSPSPPYTLDDMAEDVIGLMDGLKIKKAHICGFSMGGMIAQTAAINHEERFYSLISIYSSTGNPLYVSPSPSAVGTLFSPPPTNLDDYTEWFVKSHLILSGKELPFDEKWHKKLAKDSFTRSDYHKGVGRHILAVTAHGDRSSKLAKVELPSLVIHGKDDPLVPVQCGIDTAKVLPDAELLTIEGMGHALPHNGPWFQILDAITAHARKAEKKRK